MVPAKEPFFTEAEWDIDLLSDYNHQVLENKPKPWLNWRFNASCPGIFHNLKHGNFDAILMVGRSRN